MNELLGSNVMGEVEEVGLIMDPHFLTSSLPWREDK